MNGDAVPDHAERGAPADGIGHVDGTRRPTTSTSPQQPATEPSCSSGAGRRLHRPEPGCADPTRRRQPPRRARSPADVQQLPGAQGLRPVLRLRPREHGQGASTPIDRRAIPPEAEITSPEWYEQVDPARPASTCAGRCTRAAARYTCSVEVAPGSVPEQRTTPTSAGRLQAGASNWCDGTTSTSSALDGVLAQIDLADLKARFPPGTRLHRAGAAQHRARAELQRPPERRSRTASRCRGRRPREPDGTTLTGEDRRNVYLHRDARPAAGFPKQLAERRRVLAACWPTSTATTATSWWSATSDGIVHASGRDGRELPGWPVHADRCRCTPAGAPSRAATSRRRRRRDPRLARGGRHRPRRRPRGRRRRHGGQGLRAGTPTAAAVFTARGEPGLLRQAARSRSRTSRRGTALPDAARLHRARRCSPTSTATAASSR